MSVHASHLTFLDCAHDPNKVTHTWRVESNGSLLGTVTWYSPWRRYVYYPQVEMVTLYDASCMIELAEFCQRQTDLRKLERKSA